MTLITRVTRLFRADLNAVLDRVEEPDLLLRQAVREMEEALAQDEQRLKLLRQDDAQLKAREEDTVQSLRALEEELDACFAAADDDLARALLRRRLETQKFCKLLAGRHATTAQAIAALQARVDDHRERLQSMRQKVELLVDEDNSHDAHPPWAAPDFAVRDADVEVALLLEKQKRSRR